MTCSIDGCDKPSNHHGWCQKHYSRWRRNGDPLKVATRPPGGEHRVERFWQKVRRGDGCWLWTGAVERCGYGELGWAENGHVKMVRAHRFMWELTYGPIPDGLHVLHHCDNPPCVRPEHLFLGTEADNAADRTAKGRQVAKLTDAAVRDIRARRNAGESGRDLAAEYGVRVWTIYQAALGRSWKHVA